MNDKIYIKVYCVPKGWRRNENTDDVLDEVLGILDPVEKELGIEKMLTPVISRPSEEKEHIDADYEYQRENFLQSN